MLWLNGKPSTVVLGLVVRLRPVHDPAAVRARSTGSTASTLEAARDLGGGQVADVLPRHAAAVAPGDPGRLRDRGAADVRRLLHPDAAGRARADTAMFGNLIVSSIQSSLVNTGASLVIVLIVLLIAADALLPAQHERRAGAGGTMSAPRLGAAPPASRACVVVAEPVGASARFLWVVAIAYVRVDARCPSFIAVAFSFNAGKAQTTWQGFSSPAGTSATSTPCGRTRRCARRCSRA